MPILNFEQTRNQISTRPRLHLNDHIGHTSDNTDARRVSRQYPAGTFANHILQKMPTDLLKRLQPYTKRVTFKGEEFIYRPDENIEWIYFPETTAISELQILEDGRTVEVSLTGREGACGLPALYKPGRSANWAQVCTSGSAIKLDRKILKREIRTSDSVNTLFFGSIQAYITQISHKVACNAHHSAEERFPTWLLMLHDRCSVDRFKLTQEQIGRALGVYRPSITWIAKDLRERGLIDYVRGTIIILDPEGLKKRSCRCYSDAFSNKPISGG